MRNRNQLAPTEEASQYGQYIGYCQRCHAEIRLDDHDDEALACEYCIPHWLAEFTRRPAWYEGEGYDLDTRINLRGKEAFAVHRTTPSAKDLAAVRQQGLLARRTPEESA